MNRLPLAPLRLRTFFWADVPGAHVCFPGRWFDPSDTGGWLALSRDTGFAHSLVEARVTQVYLVARNPGGTVSKSRLCISWPAPHHWFNPPSARVGLRPSINTARDITVSTHGAPCPWGDAQTALEWAQVAADQALETRGHDPLTVAMVKAIRRTARDASNT